MDYLISESNNEQVFVDDEVSSLNEIKSLSFDIKVDSAYDDVHSVNNSYRNSSREIELLLIDNPTEAKQVMDTNELNSLQELENFAFETELTNFPIDFEVSFADETEQSENHNEQFFLHKVEIFVVDNIVNPLRKYNHSALEYNKAKFLHKNNLYAFDNESNFLHEDEQYMCDNNEANNLNQIRKFISKNEINGVISSLNSKENQSLNNSKEIFVVVDKHFVVNNQVISSNKNEQLLFENKVYHINVPERYLDDNGISFSDYSHYVNYIARNFLRDDKKIAFDDKKSQLLKYKKINKLISLCLNENPADNNYTDSVCYNKEIKALSFCDKNNFYCKKKTSDYCNKDKSTDYEKEGLKNHKNKYVYSLKTKSLDIKKRKFVDFKFLKEVEKTEIMKLIEIYSFIDEKFANKIMKKSDKCKLVNSFNVKKEKHINYKMIVDDKVKKTMNFKKLNLKANKKVKLKDYKKKDHAYELKEVFVDQNNKKDMFNSNLKRIMFLILLLIMVLSTSALCLMIVLADLEENN